MTIIFGSDHAGFALRRILASRAIDLGYAVSEVGARDEQPYDYPDAAAEVAARLQRGDADMGGAANGQELGEAL